MAKKLGGAVEAHSVKIGLTDTDEDTAAGDAVAFDSGEITPGDSNSGHELAGLRARGEMSDDQAPVGVTGVFIAKVEGGVTAGDDLDLVDTSVTGAPSAGHLVPSSGGPAHALSDEGGDYKGVTLNANEAAVYIR